MKHITLHGIDLSRITLNDYGKDENYEADTDRHGNWYEEHSFPLENNFFDNITLRVWEDQEPKPEYVWLSKKSCTAEELKELADALLAYYGENYYGNIFIEEPDDGKQWNFRREWERVIIEFNSSQEVQLTLTFHYRATDRLEMSFTDMGDF